MGISKNEFEESYCKKSGITIEEYKQEFNLVTLPCKCDNEHCSGWAAVDDTPRKIKAHEQFYG